VRLAGELEVETDRGRLRSADFPGRQGRVVFARLAATPYPVPREELAELVWPVRLPKSWERDLSAVISKLRTLLTDLGYEEPIANAFGCYQLQLGGDTLLDVNEARTFTEEAEAALRKGDLPTARPAADVAANLCMRPLLPGEDGEWMDGLRQEWRELLLRNYGTLAEVCRELGDLVWARQYGQWIVDRDPYRESGWAALIRGQLAGGDRAAALRTYEQARTRFVEEMGVSPGAVLEAAYQEALAADPDEPPAGPLPRGTVALLFTDIVGSVALAERLGERAMEELRRAHFEELRHAIATHEGHEVKNLGDGVMAVFPSSALAVDAAEAMQASSGERPGLAIRIGVHVGEPWIDGNDYFGKCVAVARRLCDATEGGAILVSDLVRSLSSDPDRYVDRTDRVLKGMTETTTTWLVARRG